MLPFKSSMQIGENRDKISEVMKFAVEMNGLSFGRKKSRLFSVLLPTNIFLRAAIPALLAFGLIPLLADSDYSTRIVIIPLVFQFFNISAMYLHFRSQASNVRNLILRIESGIYAYPTKHVYPPAENTRFERVFQTSKFWIIYHVLVLIGLMSNPVSYYVMGGQLKNKLILPGKFLWPIDGEISHLLTNFAQLVCFVYISIFGYTYEIIIALTCLEFQKQFDELSSKIYLLSSNRKNTDDFKSQLSHCVRHHQALNSAFQHFKACIGGYFTLELLSSFITYISLLHYLLKFGEVTMLSATFCSILSYHLMAMLLICSFGQMFYDLNDKILDTLYEIEWYKWTVAENKLIMLFANQCRRPLLVAAFNIYPAVIGFYANFIKTSYTFFNLLNSTY